MTIQTRRHNPRVRLSETIYLAFASGTRGRIIDVSEGGLRFKTPAPLQKSESSNFTFTFNGGGEIKAALSWTDESRLMGGLHFRSISPEVHKQIRNWLDRSWDANQAARGLTEQGVLREPDESAANPRRAVIFEETKSVAPAKNYPPEGKLDKAVSQMVPTSKENHLSVFPPRPPPGAQQIRESTHPSSGRGWVVALVIVFILAVAAAAAAYFYPNDARYVVSRAQAIVSNLHYSGGRPQGD